MNKLLPRVSENETAVPADLYSREYYLTECNGYKEFLEGSISSRLQFALRLAGELHGKRVLDIGSGRGEVVWYCTKAGAIACGIDYSPEAINLAKRAATIYSDTSYTLAHFQLADATHLPFAQEAFDVIFMLDIVEHLYPELLLRALGVVRRVLKKEGVLIIHTMPNLWYYRIGYPLYRIVQRMRGKKLPRDPQQRWQYVSALHVNKQDILRLKRTLQDAGFYARVWLEPTQSYEEERNKFMRFCMQILSRYYPFRWVFCDDIFALARKK
ncbi:MAG: class I SAM-dependent methyltransferase [Chloroflexi bacterium]|nr:class I SAM-dependent methyltransferase [Chloroflexota bacterium]